MGLMREMASIQYLRCVHDIGISTKVEAIYHCHEGKRRRLCTVMLS